MAVAARLFRHRTDGPLIAFWMLGNPTFWTAPVAAAALGAEAAVFVIAYDMLTQARIALGVRYLRARAPKSQSRGTALTDYAPTYGALAGLLIGVALPAPGSSSTVVAGLGIVMAGVGALLLGVAWPRRWIGRPQIAHALRGLALHFTLVPAVLALATLGGRRPARAPPGCSRSARCRSRSSRSPTSTATRRARRATAPRPQRRRRDRPDPASRSRSRADAAGCPGRDERGRAAHVDGERVRIAVAGSGT